MFRTAFALVTVLALVGGIAVSAKPTASPSSPTTINVGIWSVHTASFDSNVKSGDFSVPGHVLLTRNGGDVNADRASGNQKSDVVTLYGHVVVNDVQGVFGTSSIAGRGKGPARLTCDQLHVDGKAKVYVATGHVHYTQDTTISDSDTGRFDDTSHTMDLTGHVHVVNGPKLMSADRLHYNTLTGDIHAESDPPGSVLLEGPGGNGPSIATPRPLIIKNPLGRKPKPTPSP